jgi:hypothetical protein
MAQFTQQLAADLLKALTTQSQSSIMVEDYDFRPLKEEIKSNPKSLVAVSATIALLLYEIARYLRQMNEAGQTGGGGQQGSTLHLRGANVEDIKTGLTQARAALDEVSLLVCRTATQQTSTCVPSNPCQPEQICTSTEVECPTDTKKAHTTLNDIKTCVQAMQTSLGDVKTSVQSLQTGLSDVRTSAQAVQTELGDVKTSVQTVQTGLSDVKTSAQAMQTDLGGVKTSVQTVQKGLDDVNKSMQTFHNDYHNVKRQLIASSLIQP